MVRNVNVLLLYRQTIQQAIRYFLHRAVTGNGSRFYYGSGFILPRPHYDYTRAYLMSPFEYPAFVFALSGKQGTTILQPAFYMPATL